MERAPRRRSPWRDARMSQKRQTGPFRTESTPQPFRHGTNPVYVLCNVQVSVLVPKSAENRVIYLTFSLGDVDLTLGNRRRGGPTGGTAGAAESAKAPYARLRTVQTSQNSHITAEACL